MLWKLLMVAKGKPWPPKSGQRPGVWGQFSGPLSFLLRMRGEHTLVTREPDWG